MKKLALIAILALASVMPVQASAPNSAATCSVQYDGTVSAGIPGFSITGSGVQPNEPVAISLETAYGSSDLYGTYETTSLPDGTFVVHGSVYVSGTYSASVTLHKYDRPVATCSAAL